MFTTKRFKKLEEGIAFMSTMNAESFLRLEAGEWDRNDPTMVELMRRLGEYARARSNLENFLESNDLGNLR